MRHADALRAARRRHRGDGATSPSARGSTRSWSATRSPAAGWSSRRTWTTPSSSRWRSASPRAARSTRTSATRPSPASLEDELEKLQLAVHLGADTVMDLSTGGDIDGIRQAIIDASAACRSAPCRSTRRSRRSKARGPDARSILLDMVEHQAKQGVDYMTIHAGVLREHLPLDGGPRHRHRQPRRLADRRVDDRPPPAEPVLHALRRPAATSCAQVRRDAVASATACGPAASPTPATRPSSPSSTTLGELTRQRVGAGRAR